MGQDAQQRVATVQVELGVGESERERFLGVKLANGGSVSLFLFPISKEG
jgi:hypothetical protein